MPVTAYISQSALRHNLAQVKIHSSSKIIAVVKANAYGHNIKYVIDALSVADIFATADITEALTLRAISNKKILILADFYQKSDIDIITKNNFAVVVYNSQQIKWLLHTTKEINVWLKIDTNMHRLGLSIDEFNNYIDKLTQKNNINIDAIISHLHSSDNDEKSVLAQLDLLNKTTINYSKIPKSIANSGAIMTLKQSHLNYIRPGIMLYGVSPFAKADNNLKPVMTLVAKVIATRKIAKGAKIGYGQTYTVDKDTNMAIVNIGYADGYPRSAISGTPVLINNNICQLMGRVSMNLICVDIKNTQVTIGDNATLWGNGLAVEIIAKYSDTIAYDLLTRVSAKVVYKICQ